MQGVYKPVNVGQAPVYGQVNLPNSPSSPSTSDSVGHVLDGDDYRGTTMSADQGEFAMAYVEKRNTANMKLIHEIDGLKRELGTGVSYLTRGTVSGRRQLQRRDGM